MADKKISQLTGASTPLAGTEVLPIVQSGATVKVSAADVTAGRAVSALTYTSTVATGTAPLTVTSTTQVANLNAATAGTASNLKSNATTGVIQVAGPGAGETRVMTTPDANFTVARTDAAQTFTGAQTINGALDVNGAIDQDGTSQNFVDLSTSDVDWTVDATYSIMVSMLTTDNRRVQFSLALSFDTSNLNVRAVNFSGATVGTSGVSATVQPGDGKTYTISRNASTGKYQWQASATATGTTTVKWFLIGKY